MLVQRHYELGLLRELLIDCASGRGQLALIDGAPASGRTQLLNAFAGSAARHGATVFSAAATPAAQQQPLGVLRQLGTAGEPGTAGELADLLVRRAQDRPTLIAIDDLQFTDTASLRVLHRLSERLPDASLLVVATLCQRPATTAPPPLAELTQQPLRRISLHGLSRAAVTALVSQRLGSEVAGRIGAACHAITGGNPLLTQALIEDQVVRGRVAAPAAIAAGPAFRAAVHDYLHRWGPDHHRITAAVTLLGRHGSAELVGELLGEAPELVESVLAALSTSGLVDAGQLRHPALASAVLDGLPAERRAALHCRAAELLNRDGAAPAEVAAHLTATDATPGPWAVRPLHEAADQVLDDDPELALRYLELAVRACPDQASQLGLRAAAARVAWRVHPSAVGRQLAAARQTPCAVTPSWRDAAPAMRHQLWHADLAGAADQAQTVRAACGPPDQRTASELLLVAEFLYGRLPQRQAPQDCLPQRGCGQLFSSALRPAPGRDPAPLALWTGPADPATTAERILQACPNDLTPEVCASALLALDHAGRHQRAVAWCDALFDEALRQRATAWQAVFSWVRADMALRRGEPVAAQEWAGQSLTLLPAPSWGVLLGLPLSVLVMAHTTMGRLDAAAELLARAVPPAMAGTEPGLRCLHASGHYQLACDRPLAALDDFEQCGAAMRAWGLDVPALVPWRSDLAQAYLRLGMPQRARALVLEQLGRPAVTLSMRTRAISLRLLAACAEPAARVRILRESVKVAQRCADRLELLRSMTDLSQAYRQLGDLGNAHLVSRRAGLLTQPGHGPTPAPHTHRRTESAGPKPGVRDDDTPAGLSGAEQRVAELAADGHSNREIGRKLSITVSTVEQHLTRVYRKLNVSRRADLRSELRGQEMAGQPTITDESRVLIRR